MTYYEILEVSNNASEEVIRMAYKALARKYHPDVFSGDPQFADQKMKQLNEAFEVLSDPQQRVSYDQKLRDRHKETTTQNSSTNNSSDFDDKNDHFFKCVSNKMRDAFRIMTSSKLLKVGLIAFALILVILVVGNSWENTESDVLRKPPNSGEYFVGVRTITVYGEDTAHQIYQEWTKAGATEEAIEKLMDKYGAEQGGGYVRYISRGDYVDEVDSWCFAHSRTAGDIAIIQNAYGYTICYISGFKSNSKQQVDEDLEKNDSPPIMESEPYTGFVFEEVFYQDCVAPLTIVTTGDEGYYFVIDMIEMPDDLSLDDYSKEYFTSCSRIILYVRGGDTAELLLPIGVYEIYYATGDTWYSEDYLFGDSTRFIKCDDVFCFSEDHDGYLGWTIKLEPVPNGNLGTVRIDKTDFPT